MDWYEILGFEGRKETNMTMDNHNFYWEIHLQMSNEQNTGWFGYIGDYTTQLYWDYDKPL